MSISLHFYILKYTNQNLNLEDDHLNKFSTNPYHFFQKHSTGVLRNWDPTDDAMAEHRKHFPTCPFIKDPKGVGNVPIDSDITNGGVNLRRELDESQVNRFRFPRDDFLGNYYNFSGMHL